jgi:hypothetical protein
VVTALGKRPRAATGTGIAERAGPVVSWALNVTPVTVGNGNTVRVPDGPSRKSARPGVVALIWSRIFSRMAVALCVVKMLATTMSLLRIPRWRATAKAWRSAFR